MWVWILISSGVVAVVTLALAAVNGDRYVPRHQLSDPEVESPDRDFYGSMTLAGEPGFYEEDEDPLKIFAVFDAGPHGLTGPPSEAEVAASRRAHGYIPELDTDAAVREAGEEFAALMFDADPSIAPKGWRGTDAHAPGQAWEGERTPELRVQQGYEAPLPAGSGPGVVLSCPPPGPDPSGFIRGGWCEPDTGERIGALIGWLDDRLADKHAAVLLADVTGFMLAQDADVQYWLAERAVTWARLEAA